MAGGGGDIIIVVEMLVFAEETPNFITDYELKFWVYKELVIYIFCDFSHKSHTINLMD